MFGFLRPDHGGCLGRRYRQVYAAMCAFQRKEYGQLSGLFNSYEAIFLYHLAIDSGACEAPAALTPTCCRLRSDPRNRWNIDLEIAEFCSAYAMVLAAVKIEDDVRDNGSMLSRCTESFFRRKFAAARTTLDRINNGLSARLRQHVHDHLALERRGEFIAMEDYVLPTANAFGEIFAAFETLCQTRIKDASSKVHSMRPVGESIGRAIISADCAFDFDRDRARRDYNPLPSRAARESAIHFAQGALSDAGWRCWSDEVSNVCSFIMRSSFDRLGRFIDQLAMPPQKFALLRRGDCDCPVDVCCSVCGESACSGCGEVACSSCGDVACDSMCSHAGDACCYNGPDCSPSCDCCIHCEPCNFGSREKKRTDEQTPPPLDEPVGEDGTSVGSIEQHGVVSVQGRTYPARASRLIHDGEQITVLQANRFGLTVG